jgi:pyruvate carboxylase
MTINLSDAHKALLASYGRSLLASAIATYTATQDPTATLHAVWAAAIPTAMRYLNPKDGAFGRD